jgi:hypothetical protein
MYNEVVRLLGFLFLCIPLLGVMKSWKWVLNKWILRVTQFLLLVLPFSHVSFIILVGEEYPRSYIILDGIFGLAMVCFGFLALRDGSTYFEELYKLVGVLSSQDQTRENLLTWLNIRMPEIEEQKRLRDALNQAYPVPFSRTFFNIVLIAGGGWLMLTALEAIVGYFIQHWLEKMLSLF